VINALREKIEIASKANPAFAAAERKFLVHARETINPGVTSADVREMLIQHRIVDLVEVLVDDLQKCLFFGMVWNLRRRCANRSVVEFKLFKCILLCGAGEKPLFQIVKLLGDVVFTAELVVIENASENVFRKDVRAIFKRFG
jgi:hypothetical protein